MSFAAVETLVSVVGVFSRNGGGGEGVGVMKWGVDGNGEVSLIFDEWRVRLWPLCLAIYRPKTLNGSWLRNNSFSKNYSIVDFLAVKNVGLTYLTYRLVSKNRRKMERAIKNRMIASKVLHILLL